MVQSISVFFAVYNSYRTRVQRFRCHHVYVQDKMFLFFKKSSFNYWYFASVAGAVQPWSLISDASLCCSFLLKIVWISWLGHRAKIQLSLKKTSNRKMDLFSVKTTNWSLKFIVFFCHVDGPGKLLSLGFVVDLLHGDAPLLTPERQQPRRRGVLRVRGTRKRSQSLDVWLGMKVLTTLRRCGGPGSWAWRCPGRSVCSLRGLSPAPPASSADPLSSEPPSSWPPQLCETDRRLAGFATEENQIISYKPQHLSTLTF